MPPIPPAPFLPNLDELLRKATEEGVRQGLALARKNEEEALAKIKNEREDSTEGLFVAQDEGRMPTGVARTTLSSGPYAGLQSAKKIKREREDFPDGLFVTSERGRGMSTGTARTTLSSGPYAGLQSAKKKKAVVQIKHEREESPEGLFVTPDRELGMSTGTARTTLPSRPYAGLQSVKKEKAVIKVKREREGEHSVEDLFVAPDDRLEMSTGAGRTTISSGRYAGLQSARKRVHETVEPEEESKPRFGPPKKRAHETVDPEEESKPTFGPPKKVVKKGDALRNVQTINSRTTTQAPGWYENIDPRQQYARGDLQNLKYLLTLIHNACKDAENGKDTTQSISKIRQRVQQMEFYHFLSPILVQKSGLLDDEGLPLIFQNRAQSVNFPSEIRADAEILFRKWMSGQIDPHLFRGIVTKKGTGKEERGFKSHSMEKDFTGRVSCSYVGAGNLVNGQWWPLQLCAKRDGAHGEVEKGIHGQKGQGAYSVILSGGGYANVDTGNLVKYCGTQGIQNSPSLGTSLMLKSYETQQPLRLLRSASLPAANTYRPARGIRYDGLYRITSYEILDEKTAMHRFSLSRLGGQDPIRCSGEGMIPSNAQILELNKVREKIG